MSTKKSKTTAKEEKTFSLIDLIDLHAKGNYPYDLSTNWQPLSVLLDMLCRDEKISLHYFRLSHMIDKNGKWHEKLTSHGLVTQTTFIEADSATGYSENVTVNLVSDRGCVFFREYFQTYNL